MLHTRTFVIRAFVALALARAAAAQTPVATISPSPILQFWDLNGKPLSGGQICVYAAGTTTPVSLFKDAAGTVPWGNPITLDASGRAVAYVPASSLKFVLRLKGSPNNCSSGNILYTVDNVQDQGLRLRTDLATPGANVPDQGLEIRTDLAAPTGAGLMGYTQTGTYPAGTVGKRLERTINVADAPYNAKGDGVADDTAAFQAAINAATAGATIYVPAASYVVGAITMNKSVAVSCAAGTTFLASSDNEIMWNVGSGAWQTGITGVGGYCTISGNGKANFQAVGVTGSTGLAANETFENIYVTNAAIGVETTGMILSNFTNFRVFLPTVAGFEFESGTTTTTCTNCSAIATAGSPIGFTVHNGGQITFVNGAFEGTLQNFVYAEGDTSFIDVDFENSGTANSTPWVFVGNQGGSSTAGISFLGCNFLAGASYGMLIEQVQGLTVHGSTFITTSAAFGINNSGSANGAMRGLDFRGNYYAIGGLPYNPAKVFAYAQAAGTDLSNNVGTDSPNPTICIPVIPGSSVTPPAAALANYMAQGWCDGLTGLWNYEWKDGSGTIHRQITVSDTGFSGIAQVPNLVITGGASAPNALVGTLNDSAANTIAVAPGLHVYFHLTGGLSLAAGSGNTFNLNGSGVKPVMANSNLAGLTTALSSGSYVDLMYNGSGWAVMTQ